MGASRARLIALAEVSIAFALMHIGFRAFKRFTSLGQLEVKHEVNFSPGVMMILVAGVFMLVRRMRLSQAGITLRPHRRGVNAAMVCILVYTAAAIGALACGLPRTPDWTSPAFAGIVAALAIVVTIVTLWILHRLEWIALRIPAFIGLAFIVALVLTPLIARIAADKPVVHTALTLLWLIIGAAIGEELFFRGYMQTRLNLAFGRSWRLLGVQWGPGLLIAAAFFGLIHVLNPYDYFRGAGHFAWWHGLATAAALYYGFLRERTGSIVAPVLVHVFVNVAARLPGWLGGL